MSVRSLPDDTTNGIAALNVNLASGALVLQGAWEVFNKQTGALYQLSGLGTGAQFVLGGGGGPAAALTTIQTTQVQNDGVPFDFTTRALTQADSRTLQRVAAAATATVPNGLAPGFGVTFRGAGTLAFSGPVTEARQAGGASPYFCTLFNIGTDQYEVRGTRP